MARGEEAALELLAKISHMARTIKPTPGTRGAPVAVGQSRELRASLLSGRCDKDVVLC